MEQLTNFQLAGCEEILRQIEEEHRKHELLSKENEILNSKISAISISTKKELIKDNVFKCLVKVFNSLFAAYDLLSDKISPYELETAIRDKKKKYYFVEIYVANSFQKRIIHHNWLINACLKNSSEQISKSINVKSKITNPVCMLIPFDDSNEEAILKVKIAWPEGQHWPHLQVAEVPIDISYHFDVVNTSKMKSTNSKILQVFKLNHADTHLNLNRTCRIQFCCQIGADLFLEKILQNSYHNLDPRHQATFSRINDILTIKISVGSDEEVALKLDTLNNTLSIDGNFKDLYLLKKYFINELPLETFTLKTDSLKSLKEWKKSLEDGIEHTVDDIYSAIRRLVL